MSDTFTDDTERIENGWRLVDNQSADCYTWECLDCGREKAIPFIRNPDPTPDSPHGCAGGEAA